MKKVVVFVSVLIIMLSTGCSVKKVEELTDAEKFAREFNVSENNPFIYADFDDILNVFENGSGIIFLADSDYEGSLKAAKYLLKAAKENEILNIYYYNPKKIEEKNPKKYKKLYDEIKSDLEKEEEEFTLILPTVYSLKDGKIINYSNYFANEEELSEEYLTKKKVKEIKNKYKDILTYKEYIEE